MFLLDLFDLFTWPFKVPLIEVEFALRRGMAKGLETVGTAQGILVNFTQAQKK